MPPNSRDVIRRFDGLINENNEPEALKYAYEMIQELDAEREYSDSINVLLHIIDTVPNGIIVSKAISHLLLRCMITGDTVKLKEYGEKIEEVPSTVISNIVLRLLDSREKSSKNEYILDGIEKQTIFGKFEPLTEVPLLEFENEDSVYSTIEDNFSQGRYIVNLIQSSTNFHHAINVDVGTSFDANIVEKRRLMKFD